MTGVGDKVAYVKSQRQTRNHHCHWPGCERQVPPAMWGCRPHWYALPAKLRDSIWRTFKPGQEVKGTPSTEYVAAARAVQEWIAQHQQPRSLLRPATKPDMSRAAQVPMFHSEEEREAYETATAILKSPDFEALRAERDSQVEKLRQRFADEEGVPLQQVRTNHAPSACYCACGMSGPCEHRWDGPEWQSDDGCASSSTCSRCGVTAMSHDMRVMP